MLVTDLTVSQEALSLGLWGLFVGGAYFTIGHGRAKGQTIGKWATKIRVGRQTGEMHAEPLGYVRSFLRWLCTLVFWGVPPFFVLVILDYLWPLWDRRGQALHDKVVDSIVVRRGTDSNDRQPMPR